MAKIQEYHSGTEVEMVLDADVEVVVAAETERSSNDTLTAAPADFDKIAACNLDQAIWVVKYRSEDHEVIHMLHSPDELVVPLSNDGAHHGLRLVFRSLLRSLS